jgi:putative DNA primase/helicase
MVDSTQRFSQANPCPVCGGGSDDTRGTGTRCYGFISDDEQWAHCSRNEYSDGCNYHENSQTYSHRLDRLCPCGHSHTDNDNSDIPIFDGELFANVGTASRNGSRRNENGHRVIDAAYPYYNEAGEVVYEAVRYRPKDFSFRHTCPDGKVTDSRGGDKAKCGCPKIPLVLYGLPELSAADRNLPVYFTEGEKDRNRLVKLGLIATTTAMGAKNSHQTQNVAALLGRDVVILPDNDNAGYQYGQDIAAKLRDVAISVKVLDLPGLPADGGDVSDWLDAGNTVATLQELAAKCPKWEPPKEASPSKLNLIPLREVQREVVEELWPKRIPRGKLSVIAGDPGMAKSYLSLDIVARLSVGAPWPDGSGSAPRCKSLILSAEDDINDTIAPRLDKLGGNPDDIICLGLLVKDKDDKEVLLSLVDQLPAIEAAIKDRDIQFMVIDPLLAFTGSVDAHRMSEVRGLLSPIAAMAQRTHCAIYAVMHLNKSSSEQNLLYRVNSSLDFVAAARSVMAVAKHPEEPQKFVLVPLKANLSAPAQPLAYHFTEAGEFSWIGPVSIDTSQILASPKKESERIERDDAIEFIQVMLKDGPQLAATMRDEAKQLGISERTLVRAKEDLAKEDLKVVAYRENAPGGKRGEGAWYWKLPPDKPEEPPQSQETNVQECHSRPLTGGILERKNGLDVLAATEENVQDGNSKTVSDNNKGKNGTDSNLQECHQREVKGGILEQSKDPSGATVFAPECFNLQECHQREVKGGILEQSYQSYERIATPTMNQAVESTLAGGILEQIEVEGRVEEPSAETKVSETAKKGYERITTIARLREVVKLLVMEPVFALDLETKGPKSGDALDPFKGSIRLVSLASPSGTYVLDVQDFAEDPLPELIPLLKSAANLKLAHNWMFDARFLERATGVLPTNLFDTYLSTNS